MYHRLLQMKKKKEECAGEEFSPYAKTPDKRGAKAL